MSVLANSASAAQEQKVVFSWTPGEARAKTQAGDVDFKLAPGSKLVDCPVGKGALAGKDGRIGHADVRLGEIPEKGTISFWLKFSREVRLAGMGKPGSAPVLSCEDLTVNVIEGASGSGVGVIAGELPGKKNRRGKFVCDFTHFRADQWYHFVITYNAPVANAWRGMLYGVTQPEPWWQRAFRFADRTTRIEISGLFRREGAESAVIAVGPIKWTGGQTRAEDILAELDAIKGWKVPPNRGEGVLESVDDLDGEALGGEILYENSFDRPLEKELWVTEGPGRVEVKDGRLLKHSPPRTDKDLVLWLKKKLPRDFVAAWDIQPSKSKARGLTIVHFAAMGTRGRDLFDPALAKRDGSFGQYINGDIRCYHCSYYAGTRGSANLRKNEGFRLVGMGRDLIGPAVVRGRKGPSRVVLLRRGPRIEVAVDKKRFMLFEDDGKAYGPAYEGGYLGLRQMFTSGTIAYDNLVIRKLRK